MTRTITVIICTYNRRELVLDAIASVIGQTRPADEVIVAVDGSTDGTADAIQAQFPSVIVSEAFNRGRSVAFNRAVFLATSQWIATLDDDDLFLPEKLEEVDRFLDSNPSTLAVNHPMWKVQFPGGNADQYGLRDFTAASSSEAIRRAASAEPVSDWSHLGIAGHSFSSLLRANCGAFSGSVVHRQTAVEAGLMSPSQACGDDWTFFLNVARLTEWMTIDKRLGIVGHHAGRAPSNLALMILATRVNAWLSGRPLVLQSSANATRDELMAYGKSYRKEFRALVWGQLRSRHFRAASQSWHLASALLPRRRDRLGIAIPSHLATLFDRIVP